MWRRTTVRIAACKETDEYIKQTNTIGGHVIVYVIPSISVLPIDEQQNNLRE